MFKVGDIVKFKDGKFQGVGKIIEIDVVYLVESDNIPSETKNKSWFTETELELIDVNKMLELLKQLIGYRDVEEPKFTLQCPYTKFYLDKNKSWVHPNQYEAFIDREAKHYLAENENRQHFTREEINEIDEEFRKTLIEKEVKKW